MKTNYELSVVITICFITLALPIPSSIVTVRKREGRAEESVGERRAGGKAGESCTRIFRDAQKARPVLSLVGTVAKWTSLSFI